VDGVFKVVKGIENRMDWLGRSMSPIIRLRSFVVEVAFPTHDMSWDVTKIIIKVNGSSS
jgi:hypothetical protein